MTGTRTRGQDVEDVDAVAAAEDAVLVLDDRDVARVERRGGRARRVRRYPMTSWCDDQRPGRLQAVDDPDDTDVGAAASSRCDGEGRGEGGQAALRGGIGAEDAEAEWPWRPFCAGGASQRECAAVPRAGPDRHPRASWPAGRAHSRARHRVARLPVAVAAPWACATASASEATVRIAVLASIAHRIAAPLVRAVGAGRLDPRRGSGARGHDVTLFATADSPDGGSPARRGAAPGTRRTRRSTRRSASRCTSRRSSSGPTQFDVISNQFDFLPLTYSRLTPHPGGDDDPRLLLGADRAGLRAPTTTSRTTCRSATRTVTPRSPTPRRSTTASTWTRSRSAPATAGTCCSSVGSTPTRAPTSRSRSPARSGMPLVIAGVVHDEAYFRELVAAARRRRGRALRRVRRARRARPAARRRRRAAAPHRLRRSRSGCRSSRRSPPGTPVIATPRGSLPELVRHGVTGFLVHDADGAVAAVGGLPTIDRAPAAARPRPGSARTGWSTTTSGSSTTSSPAGAGAVLPQHDGGRRRTVDVHLITDDGVRECAVDELPALLAGRHGIVWVDIPQWSSEAADVLDRPCSGCTRWRVHDCEVRNRLPKLHAYPGSLFLVLHAPERGAGGHVHHVELDRLIGPRYLVTVHGPVNPAVPIEVALRDTARGPRAHPRRPAAAAHVLRHLARDRLDADAAHGEVRRGPHERRVGARATRHRRRLRQPRALPRRDVPHPARAPGRQHDRRADRRDLPAPGRAAHAPSPRRAGTWSPT